MYVLVKKKKSPKDNFSAKTVLTWKDNKHQAQDIYLLEWQIRSWTAL